MVRLSANIRRVMGGMPMTDKRAAPDALRELEDLLDWLSTCSFGASYDKCQRIAVLTRRLLASTHTALLHEALRELRRWRSCQSIGVCRNCADDGVILRIASALQSALNDKK